MNFPSRCALIAVLALSVSNNALAGLDPIPPLEKIPPIPSPMAADAEPIGTPVNPSTDIENVQNSPEGSAPAAGSNRSGAPTPGAGADNKSAPKPADTGPTPSTPLSNMDAKPVKSGLKGQDNQKGANDQQQKDKGKPDPDASNKGKKKRDRNDPDSPDPFDSNMALEDPDEEETDNGALSGKNGAGGGNSKKPPGPKSPGSNSGGRGRFPPLTKLDASMDPDFNLPGAPVLPSKCADEDECLPCFEEANAAMDKQRVNLEKLRSIYDFTHRFTREGTEVLSAAGAAGGGVAQLGAVAEIHKVNDALDGFDETVRGKSTELLGKLDKGLKQMAHCEAEFVGDDTWYAHHGQVYLQFMKGHYSF